MCSQIMELSQDHPVALILSQTVQACLFPLPPFLPPIILCNRIMTLKVKQSLSSLLFKSHPPEPCYWCCRLSMQKHQKENFGARHTWPFSFMVSSLSERPQFALASLQILGPKSKQRKGEAISQTGNCQDEGSGEHYFSFIDFVKLFEE